MQQVVRFVKLSSLFAGRANDELKTYRTQRTKVAEALPSLVDRLIQQGQLTEGQRKEALAVLQDPQQMLGLLEQATTKLAAAEKSLAEGRLNSGVPVPPERSVKRASDDGARGGFVGRRAPLGARESDRIFHEMVNQ
jgi:hypothetical protein